MILARGRVHLYEGHSAESVTSIVRVLAATGVALASHHHRWQDSTLQVKLGLVVLVLALIVGHIKRPQWHVLDAAIFAVSLAIVWLGIVVAG